MRSCGRKKKKPTPPVDVRQTLVERRCRVLFSALIYIYIYIYIYQKV